MEITMLVMVSLTARRVIVVIVFIIVAVAIFIAVVAVRKINDNGIWF